MASGYRTLPEMNGVRIALLEQGHRRYVCLINRSMCVSKCESISFNAFQMLVNVPIHSIKESAILYSLRWIILLVHCHYTPFKHTKNNFENIRIYFKELMLQHFSLIDSKSTLESRVCICQKHVTHPVRRLQDMRNFIELSCPK